MVVLRSIDDDGHLSDDDHKPMYWWLIPQELLEYLIRTQHNERLQFCTKCPLCTSVVLIYQTIVNGNYLQSTSIQNFQTSPHKRHDPTQKSPRHENITHKKLNRVEAPYFKYVIILISEKTNTPNPPQPTPPGCFVVIVTSQELSEANLKIYEYSNFRIMKHLQIIQCQEILLFTPST